MNSKGSVILPVAVALIGVASMSTVAHLLNNGIISSWKVFDNELVNYTFTMQFMVLPMSFLALGFIYMYDRTSFRDYFRFSFKGSNDNEWNLYGPLVAIAFTIGNAMMMSFSVMSQHGRINETFVSLIPLVLLFSATNSWFEEIFTRFVIVAGLSKKLQPGTICIVSSLVFGVPHFFGTPSGFFGVIAAGTLGYFLAKSVVETRSMAWALLIHFLQDVVIFGAGAMILAAQH